MGVHVAFGGVFPVRGCHHDEMPGVVERMAELMLDFVRHRVRPFDSQAGTDSDVGFNVDTMAGPARSNPVHLFDPIHIGRDAAKFLDGGRLDAVE